MLTGEVRAKCINACLAPVASLDCCSVVTVEGLGDCVKGFNPVQGMRSCPLGMVNFGKSQAQHSERGPPEYGKYVNAAAV